MNVGERIKAIIQEKGFKQYAAAKKAGIDAKQFNAMLNNRKIIKAEDLAVICKAIGCSPNDILEFPDTDT